MVRALILFVCALSASSCSAFMHTAPMTLRPALTAAPAVQMVAQRRKATPKKAAAVRQPAKPASKASRSKSLKVPPGLQTPDAVSGFLSKLRGNEQPAASKKESTQIKMPDIPSFSMPSFGDEPKAAKKEPASSLPLPQFSMPSMPSISDMGAPSAPAPTPEVEDTVFETAPAAAAPTGAAATVGNGLKQLGSLLLSALTTILQLLIAKIQLAAVRKVRAAQATIEAKAAQLEAAPAMLIAKFKRMAYVAPFYARAAMELMVEDVERKLEAAKKEATRRYEDAPRYFGAELQAAQAEASARAQQALDDALAAPEKLKDEVVATVESSLSSAQKTVDDALAQAKAQAQNLRK